MRIFAYGRVSTSDQTASNQLQELLALGYDVKPSRWFADCVSGKVCAFERPEFSRMMERLEEGDLLLVSKLDRLGRDMIDVVRTLRALTDKGIKAKVIALGDVDLTSTAGKAIVGILAVVAEMERDLLVERTQAGLARAKAEGKQLGRPSKSSDEVKNQILIQLRDGMSVSQVAREFKLSRATILNIRNIFLNSGCPIQIN